MRSNIFANIENKFAFASEEEIIAPLVQWEI